MDASTKTPIRSVRTDEILPIAEACRRLGWGKRTLQHARRCGLRIIRFGRCAYVRGVDVHAFFAKLAEGSGKDVHSD